MDALYRRTPSTLFHFPGGHRREVTPVPIPNTEVKLSTADGTAWETAWESRSLPGLFLQARFERSGPFLLYALERRVSSGRTAAASPGLPAPCAPRATAGSPRSGTHQSPIRSADGEPPRTPRVRSPTALLPLEWRVRGSWTMSPQTGPRARPPFPPAPVAPNPAGQRRWSSSGRVPRRRWTTG